MFIRRRKQQTRKLVPPVPVRQIKRNRTRKGSGIEVLEQRLMMAGDVMVSLITGDLVVRGDALDNQVEISEPTPGTIRVAGLEGTTVNGEAFALVSGVVDDFRIRMKQGGEDYLAIQGPIGVPDDLLARLGDGALTIEGSLGPVEIAGDLNILTRGDVTLLNEVEVEGETRIEAGGSVVAVAGQAALPDFASADFSHSLDITNPYFPLAIVSF